MVACRQDCAGTLRHVGERQKQPPRVFVSYSHDDEEHRRRALLLTERLRSVWVDAWIDRYVENDPPHSWPAWMRRELTKADFVIMVCSEPYRRRVEDDEAPGRGLGARWEGAMITTDIYTRERFSETSPYIPICFEPSQLDFIPYFVAQASHYVVDVDTGKGLDALVRRLLHEPEVVPHPLGAPLSVQEFATSVDASHWGGRGGTSLSHSIQRRPAIKLRGVQPKPLGSMASAAKRRLLTGQLEALTFSALEQAQEGADQEQILFSIREVIATFTQLFTYSADADVTASVWATQVHQSLNEAHAQLIVRIASPEAPTRTSSLELGNSINIMETPVLLEATMASFESIAVGVQRRVEPGFWDAAWVINREGALDGFLQVESSKVLSRHYRLMGQELADRLAPLFGFLRRESAPPPMPKNLVLRPRQPRT